MDLNKDWRTLDQDVLIASQCPLPLWNMYPCWFRAIWSPLFHHWTRQSWMVSSGLKSVSASCTSVSNACTSAINSCTSVSAICTSVSADCTSTSTTSIGLRRGVRSFYHCSPPFVHRGAPSRHCCPSKVHQGSHKLVFFVFRSISIREWSEYNFYLLSLLSNHIFWKQQQIQ